MNENDKYQQMVERHLAEIFSETDDTKRMAALRQLYAEDAVLYEPDNIVRGIEAISATVSGLLKNFPPQFSFVASGPALIHHEMCCAPWTAGTPDQANIVTGYDVVQFANGKIQAVYVFLNPAP
ncbi:MAG TPA: nuclear transport factor 2 family protein [Terriglobus sp.]